MNHGYFDYGKNPKTPNFQPQAGIKMAQVLGSPVYIYGTGIVFLYGGIPNNSPSAFVHLGVASFCEILTWNYFKSSMLQNHMLRDHKKKKVKYASGSYDHK